MCLANEGDGVARTTYQAQGCDDGNEGEEMHDCGGEQMQDVVQLVLLRSMKLR